MIVLLNEFEIGIRRIASDQYVFIILINYIFDNYLVSIHSRCQFYYKYVLLHSIYISC
jgi:hypothetical protein